MASFSSSGNNPDFPISLYGCVKSTIQNLRLIKAHFPSAEKAISETFDVLEYLQMELERSPEVDFPAQGRAGTTDDITSNPRSLPLQNYENIVAAESPASPLPCENPAGNQNQDQESSSTQSTVRNRKFAAWSLGIPRTSTPILRRIPPPQQIKLSSALTSRKKRKSEENLTEELKNAKRSLNSLSELGSCAENPGISLGDDEKNENNGVSYSWDEPAFLQLPDPQSFTPTWIPVLSLGASDLPWGTKIKFEVRQQIEGRVLSNSPRELIVQVDEDGPFNFSRITKSDIDMSTVKIFN